MAFDFKNGYNSQAFRNFLRVNLLRDKFNEYATPEKLLPGKTQYFVNNEIYRIGDIKGIEKDVSILQIKQKSKNDPRVSLTKDTFKLMQDYGIKNAIVVLRVDNVSSWRLSLLTTSYNDDLKKELSNPKRFSYILGPYEKVKTPEKYLIEQGFIKSFEDLKNRFNVEVVRKDFFTLYIDLFLELYDNIISNNTFSKIIKEGDIEPVSFAKNLMGKLIFLYFIQKKGWLGITDKNIPFGEGDRDFFKHNIDKLAANGDLFHKQSNFYNDFLEPLFYSGLNRENPDDRHEKLEMKVPYLNGGLFEEEYDREGTTINLNNQIFKNIIDSFDTYNFTIDEDDPIDSEIAVDPEMLGMIFESMISITKDNIDEYLENFKKAKAKCKVEFVNQDNILNLHLTKGNNKDLGAFYTPREIVNYMTRESLYNYLVNELQKKNPSGGEEIKHIVRKLFEYKDKHLTKGEIDEQEESGYLLIKNYVFDIKDALTNVKILDPAIGSGAFPMGILQEILRLTRYLIDVFHLEKKSNYEIKKYIIQNNVHGVDIDPGAVDIARLRFWLCLIVDADYPVPLPNLDFKFVCANTLIPLDQGGIFVNEEFVSTLKSIKDKFFLCSDHEEKKQLKNLFSDTKESLFTTDKSKLDSYRGADGRVTKAYKEEYKRYVNSLADKRVKQMLQWDPFDTTIHNERFDPYMMFDIGQFDIIIANPPYIGEKGHKEIFQEVAETKLGKYYLGKMDYFYFFFHLALDLCKDGGVVSFITTNYYPTALGGRKLRKDFKERAIIKDLLNFNELKIFESALGQHNIITILQKGQRENEQCRLINVKMKGLIKSDIFYSIINGDNSETDYNYVKQFEIYEGSENYIRLSKEEENTTLSRILSKIKNNNDILGNISDVNNGIFSGCDSLNEKKKAKYNIVGRNVGDGVFIITTEEYSKLKLLDSEKKIVKKLFKNSDIRQYICNEDNELYIINLRYTDRPNLDDYPNIKNHLLPYKDMLADRPTTGTLESAFSKGMRYIMSTSRRLNMEGPKIVVPQRSPINTFGYNDGEWYAASDVFFITNPKKSFQLKYLLALLNSKLYYIWLYNKGKRKGETLELIANPLSEIPIKEISVDAQQPFIDLVDKIIEKKKSSLDDDTTELEKQIDQLVYKLYELTDEEIQFVEENSK